MIEEAMIETDAYRNRSWLHLNGQRTPLGPPRPTFLLRPKHHGGVVGMIWPVPAPREGWCWRLYRRDADTGEVYVAAGGRVASKNAARGYAQGENLPQTWIRILEEEEIKS